MIVVNFGGLIAFRSLGPRCDHQGFSYRALTAA